MVEEGQWSGTGPQLSVTVELEGRDGHHLVLQGQPFHS